jgi:FRG domain
MLDFELDDIRNKYPGFYNIYPIENEISIHSITKDSLLNKGGKYFLDDYYGRIIESNSVSPYGDGRKSGYYLRHYPEKIIDTLRVPFRKIPIYELDGTRQIQELIETIAEENPSHSILLRGQTTFYPLDRKKSETAFLYGEDSVKEPSFQPSFLRSNFNETFIYSLWHSQTALLLDDVGVDLSKFLTAKQLRDYYDDVTKIKGSPHFTPIALGFAQHYGMPSIGLDLTKDLKVALWFAANRLDINNEGIASTYPISDFSDSTLYIFRCPDEAVFSHKQIKPKFINNTRPDRQDAWFSHVGWGLAKNQLASYLVCGVRLTSNILNLFEATYAKYLFPSRNEDLVLNTFLDIVENEKYIGEVRRALNKIYTLKE